MKKTIALLLVLLMALSLALTLSCPYLAYAEGALPFLARRDAYQ